MAVAVRILVRGRHRSRPVCEGQEGQPGQRASSESQPILRAGPPPHLANRSGGAGRRGARVAVGRSGSTLTSLMTSLPYFLDLVGTFVFALSGATAAVKHRLDLFGVLVLSFAAANTGGITRDLLIGAVPPGAINDWRYAGVSVAAGIITFYFPGAIKRRWSPVLWFDAAGLALFAVSGAHKA